MKRILIGLVATLALSAFAFAANGQMTTSDGEEQPVATPVEVKKERPKPTPVLEQAKADIDKAV
ncbi:MAG: hypothetical protein EHM48_04500, partial [Planctomycetaceae bacterium]